MVRRARRILVVVGACLLMVMSVGGTAFAAGPPGTHPVIDTVSKGTVTPDFSEPGTGCATLHVVGHAFYPSTLNNTNHALVIVIASTDGQSTFEYGAYLTVDSRGRIVADVPVCDVSVIPDLIEWSAVDFTTGYWANRDYTKLTGTLSQPCSC